jgi:DNA-binding MltR family transcriptional regulator
MTAKKEYKPMPPVRVGFGPISLAHDQQTVNGFLEQFQQESDKSIVISSAAIIEEVLEELLIFKSKRVDDNKLHDRLFKYTGPLSSFASKIDVCYFLGYIPTDFYNDLRAALRTRKLRPPKFRKAHTLLQGLKPIESAHVASGVKAPTS